MRVYQYAVDRAYGFGRTAGRKNRHTTAANFRSSEEWRAWLDGWRIGQLLLNAFGDFPYEEGSMYYSFRATFEQPKIRAGQILVKFSQPVTVEVFHQSGTRWRARDATTQALYRDVDAGSPEDAKRQVERGFERRLTDWAPIEPNGKPLAEHRKITTHLSNQPIEGRTVRSICGKSVKTAQIVSSEPSCWHCKKSFQVSFLGSR